MKCPYCEEENPAGAEVCQSCQQRFTMTIVYEEPLNQLGEIGNMLVRRDIPADPSLIHKTFVQIEQQIQNIMDRATDIIEQNIREIEKIRQEAPDLVGELDLDTFNLMLDEFDNAQNEITGGMDNIRNSLLIANTAGDITRELLEYTSALQEISEGLVKLESVTVRSNDYELMTSPPPNLDSPDEVFQSQKELGKAIKSLDIFDETEDPRLLKFALMKIDRVHEVLLELLEEYEPGAAEEYEEELLPIIEEELYGDEEEIPEEMEEPEEDEQDDETAARLEEQKMLELMYKDPESIVSDADIEELMVPPDVVDEEEILMDPDWREIEKLEEPEEEPEIIPNELPPEEGEETVLVETFSELRSIVKEN